MELGRFAALFAEISRTATDGVESVGTRLCVACVELLDVGAAGILLVDDDGGVSCFATSAPARVCGLRRRASSSSQSTAPGSCSWTAVGTAARSASPTT